MISQFKRLILASASPRRKDLLTLLGLQLEVRPSEMLEPECHGEPAVRALDVARAKLAIVKGSLGTDFSGVCLSADTVVAMGERAFGKPSNEVEAREMLQALSGNVHTVFTAFRMEDEQGKGIEQVVGTEVEMLSLSPSDLDWYVSTGEPFDKAGGYGIQGAGGSFVRTIKGSYSNVIGLPLAEVRQALINFGVLGIGHENHK